MSLKYEVTEVPAGFEQVYTQTESGTFRLNVEGVVPASEVESLKQKNREFRDTNTNLLKTQKELSSFAELFGGAQNVSPDSVQQKLNELAARQADEMVTTMKSKYEDELKQLREANSKTTGHLSQLMLGDQVQKAGLAHGVQETAYDDVMNRAATMFEVVEGAVVFKGKELDADGKPYTVQTWMASLATKAPHLFKQSQGTGATRNAKTVANVQQADRSTHDLLSSGLNQLTKSAAKRLS